MCRHIIDSIAAYATRSTQVVLLRVSRQFFLAAGRALYRCVKVDGCNIPGFFLGVYPNLDLVYSKPKKTKSAKATKLTKLLGPNVDPLSLLNPTTDTASTSTGSKAKKKKVKQKKGSKKNAPSATPTVSTVASSEIVGAGAAIKDHTSECPSDADTKVTLPQSNEELTADTFKKHLLKYVKVFTIGSHKAKLCHHFGNDVAAILPNVQTLRVAPSMRLACKLNKLCETDGERGCPFLHVPMSKLVLRNLDGNGLGSCCPIFWDRKGLEKVVLFFPTDGRAYDTYGFNDLIDLAKNWHGASSIVIVFYPLWETWGPNPTGLESTWPWPEYRTPIDPLDVIKPVRHIMGLVTKGYTVYGLESLVFTSEDFTAEENDDLVDTFKHFFPNISLTNDRLIQLVRDEIRTGSLDRALLTGRYEEGDFEETIDYRTLIEYLDNYNSRPAEISAHDAADDDD